MIKIKFFKITDSPETNYEDLINYLPLSIQDKLINRCIREDRIRSVIGKLILKKLLLEEGFSENILNFIKLDAYRRPFIDNNIDFNISHSGDYIICAFSKNNRLGIDIEMIKPLNIKDFAPILTKKEHVEIINHTFPINSFYSLWTQKEAVIKANGKGLAISFADVIVNTNSAICENFEWKLMRLNINDKYESHLAFKTIDNEIEQVELKIDDLFNLSKKYNRI